MSQNFSTIRDLIAKSFSRYIKVRPDGFDLGYNNQIISAISAQIVTSHPARTLYQNKHPVCRSLDGRKSTQHNRTCAGCLDRRTCTPQICIEIVYNNIPLSLLLAYTSARNFLEFVSIIEQRGLHIDNIPVRLNVRDRGRWGEVCFALNPATQKSKD